MSEKEVTIYRKELAEIKQRRLKANPTKSELQTKRILKKYFYNIEFQKIFYADFATLIVDFYLPYEKVVIEVDGSYHEKKNQKNMDRSRDMWFKKNNIHVLRVKNKDVMKTDFVVLINNLLKKEKKIFPKGYIRIHEQNNQLPLIEDKSNNL